MNLTDDEILARAMLTPMSNRVPLKKGDQVIAMETFTTLRGIEITKGLRGKVVEILSRTRRYAWDGIGEAWANTERPIGKLVPREGR